MTPLPPTTLLVSSKQDPAGTLIHSIILESEHRSLFSHLIVSKRLIEIDDSFKDWMDKGITSVLFLSRHAGKGAVPTLTVHPTGNYASADLGGKPKTLSKTDPHLMYTVFTGLKERTPKGYTVSYEVTHHGPTSVLLPSFFVEIGSTEIEWHDKQAAQAVAEAVMWAMQQTKQGDDRPTIPLIGFGGSHYAARQTEISSISRGAFGHMMPTRQIPHLTDEIFTQMIKMSKAEAVYIDKKSVTHADISKISTLAAAHNLPLIGQNELVNLRNTPFPVYLEALSLIPDLFPDTPVTANPHHIEELSSPVPLIMNQELLSEAQKIDQNAVLDAISSIPCIHFSGNGIAILNAFIVEQSHIAKRTDELIQACIRIICTAHHCTYLNNVLTIQKQRFNPKKAQNFGIRPGPAYGKLMAGQSIIQDGCEIHPDMVMDHEEYTIIVSSDT